MRASALAAGAFDKHSRAITLALALLLAAWAMPTFNRSRATYDYLVVFDITQSMNVADYELGEVKRVNQTAGPLKALLDRL